MRSKPIAGRMSTTRRAWLTLDRLQVMVYRFPGTFLGDLPEGATKQVEEYSKLIDDVGDETTLTFVQNGRKFSVNLTRFTAAELLALENFITATIDRARPVVIARDRIVQEVYHEQGEDSFDRLYRRVPDLHVRAGEVGQYREGVRERSSDAAQVGGLGYNLAPIRSVTDREVAERDASDGFPEDDGTEADFAEGIFEVGEGEEEPSPF